MQQLAIEKHRQAALIDSHTPVTPAQAVHLTQQAFGGSRRFILDGNVSFAWADRMFDVLRPLGRLTPGANGCMGTGVPFALGSCMAEPGTPVVVITGDFALGVSLQDLETLVRLDTAVTIVLLCNGGNSGRLRQQQFWRDENPDRITRFTEGIRYDRVMIDLGGRGACIDSVDELTTALQEAANTDTPYLIQANVRDHVPMPDF
jgi:thiamine pyrophosphate-dependent acetolactate synthase large subunit-like protein